MDMEGINVVVPTSSSYSCSSIETSNFLQELYLFTICIVKERKKSKVAQFEVLENPSFYSTRNQISLKICNPMLYKDSVQRY
jgi:hypothetical protein